ncbi:integrin alpha-M-like isoform X2 [Scomber scombrus]|uniref:integrin alpha-M-like isoform X2 n=1 Tax=Scomber scombrus TaxID=13677 RepID=UPI002DD96CD2|nr:integrin alpha-M-like isoform X2 [Scomber scombrus]
MDWIISTTVFLSVLKAALCFNIDPVAWKTVNNSAAGFGYQIVQRQSDLLVSAPLEQLSPNERGQIFKCSTKDCTPVPVKVPSFAVNMSLGLTMTSDPNTQKTLACGPTIPKDCKSITQYSGVCFEIDPSDHVGLPVPSSIEECRTIADIAFLLDGSGSVDYSDFERMKNFVKSVVKSFPGKDTKFAIAQFSSRVVIHYYFNTFNADDWESQINGINQLSGGTYTAKAIREVVNNVFSTFGGSRSDVKKILIVITDGESNDGRSLPGAANSAEEKKIVRFAVGVGNAFTNDRAKQELDTIASKPENVFKVSNFGALDAIRQNLQNQIFSIEGSQTGGESLKMEMAQRGFSAAYVPPDSTRGIQMAIVGANQWRGGFQEYKGQMLNSYEPLDIEADSYLGYSMAVANTLSGPLTILGAPRYQHRGIVMSVFASSIGQRIDPFNWQFKIGEYFGAVVCAMDVDRNSYTDLVLISAPMYMDSDREGRVYVCSLSRLKIECHFDSPLVLRGDASDQGRFGSSLAVLPDLNQDGFNDLAVGAPLENDGHGSIYIFHGERGGRGRISPAYSQRIASSEVRQGLKFFGMSISQSSFDRSNDNLPDLAVGSKGTVVLLRSRPIVMVETSVTFNPNQIQTQNSDCSTPLDNTAKICFTMTRHSVVNTASAIVNYTFTLDAQRKVPNNRAYIRDKQREQTGSLTLTFEQKCNDVKFLIQACPDDSLNPVNNELQFIFDGLPSSTGLRPSLAQQAQTTTFHPLVFEINCGTDNECVDELKVDFNFTGSSEVKVGIDELLDVTVSVENSHENSYNSRVILTYPPGLSYRKFTSLKGRIECNSLDSGAGLSQGRTDCTIDKPIFKSNAKVLFIVSYGIDTTYKLDRTLIITANATSGNQHASGSELYKIKRIDVKYSIYATIESSLSYTNFSHGKNDLQKPVQQPIVLANDNRALNLTMVIRVPVKLGDKDIWVNSNSLQIPDCQRDKDEKPTVTNVVAEIQKNKFVDCSVAWCRVFKCNRFMGSLERQTYTISANLSSGWIEQIGLESARFLLTSTATLEFDRNQYIFFLPGSNNNPLVHKIETQVEVYPEPDFTKEIVGGSLGGLALLSLLTAGLIKAGFFNSKYKNMMNEGQEAGEGAEGGEPAPE